MNIRQLIVHRIRIRSPATCESALTPQAWKARKLYATQRVPLNFTKYIILIKCFVKEIVPVGLHFRSCTRGGFRQVQKVRINLSNISDFFKRNIEINYQGPDYNNFLISHVKLRKFLKNWKTRCFKFPYFRCIGSSAPFLHFRCPGSTVRPILFASWFEDASELSTWTFLLLWIWFPWTVRWLTLNLQPMSLNRSLIDVEPITNCLSISLRKWE